MQVKKSMRCHAPCRGCTWYDPPYERSLLLLLTLAVSVADPVEVPEDAADHVQEVKLAHGAPSSHGEPPAGEGPHTVWTVKAAQHAAALSGAKIEVSQSQRMPLLGISQIT